MFSFKVSMQTAMLLFKTDKNNNAILQEPTVT